jgi:uncharacterized membrane protein
MGGMVARPPEFAASPPEDGWFDAGVLLLDDGREAKLSFDRFGTAKLSVTLDRPVSYTDLDVLRDAVKLFSHVRLEDIDRAGDYPRRHADAFGREIALPARLFGRDVVIEVVAPPGGARVPRRLGPFGAPAYQVTVVDLAGTPVEVSPDALGVAGKAAFEAVGGVTADRPDDEAGAAGTVATTRNGQAAVDGKAKGDPGAGAATRQAPDDAALDLDADTVTDAPAVPRDGEPDDAGKATALAARTREVSAPPGLKPEAVRGALVTVADGIDAALARAGAAIVGVTRQPAELLCQAAVAAAMAVFVVLFTWQTWASHARFGTYGFDLGIFDQGTWLLSRFSNPFVTVRGLNLFGDHASYILILVAPIYRLWSDPRLLLMLQVIGLALPALAIYRIASRRLANPAAGLVLTLAYLAYPAMQWAATWQFHPETLAAAFLAGAVLAADARRGRLLAICIALALLCKEDVGLVVAGFGVTLWLTGQPRWGKRILIAGGAYFLLAAFVLIPLFNGEGSPHFALNYGIKSNGFLPTLFALPTLAKNAFTFALSNNGLRYLLLIFLPLALLPFASWRSLAPVAGPIGLNLAAVHGYQHEIRYQYLATSSLFLVLAAAGGLAVLSARRRSLLSVGCVVLLLTVGIMDYRYGPALWSRTPSLGSVPAASAARYEALSLIEPDAGVSAQYHLVTHLTQRKHAYEFPNPFLANNWGHVGDAPSADDVESVSYIVLEPALLNPQSDIDRRATERLNQIRSDPQWEAIYDNGGVLVLHRTGTAGNLSPPATLQERP